MIKQKEKKRKFYSSIYYHVSKSLRFTDANYSGIYTSCRRRISQYPAFVGAPQVSLRDPLIDHNIS